MINHEVIDLIWHRVMEMGESKKEAAEKVRKMKSREQEEGG